MILFFHGWRGGNSVTSSQIRRGALAAAILGISLAATAARAPHLVVSVHANRAGVAITKATKKAHRSHKKAVSHSVAYVAHAAGLPGIPTISGNISPKAIEIENGDLT